MSEGAQRALKWLVAVVILGFVVVFTARAGLRELQSAVQIETAPAPQATDVDEQPPAEVEEGLAPAVAAFTVAGGVVSGYGAEALVIGGGEGELAVVAFHPVAVDPACVTRATLELHLNEVEGAPLDVEAAAAALPDAGALADGEELGDAPIRVETPSAPIAVTDGTPGWLAWDVQPLYVQAARESAEGAPLSFTVRLPAADQEGLRTVFAGVTDAEERAPRLGWEALADCADLFSGPAEDAGVGDA